MKMKSLKSILLVSILTLGISSPALATAKPINPDRDWEALIRDSALNEWEALVTESVENYVNLKIENGFSKLENYKIGKIIELNNDIENSNKYYVSVISDQNETLGYSVVDGNNSYEVIEFGLGDVEPITDENKDYYYTGPLSYALDLENGYVSDLQTEQEFSKDELISEMSSVTPEQNDDTIDEITPMAITNYEYKYISGVPDYQQNDNTSMEEDCVPTASANIAMYWDAKGYPNMVPSNNWKTAANRFGVLMKHNNKTGVTSSDVTPGFRAYLKERGQTNFTVSRDIFPSFTDVRNITKRNHPSLLRLDNYKTIDPKAKGGHMVTLVGFERYYDTSALRWYQQFIVHDNWDRTGKMVWLKWEKEPVTDIWEIAN
ncbi:hypothetical protein [Lederbergia citrea]|uniref:hypothetical protein n=1 Tax=Lederbergia citrea TaxID=2833581 RepID=UPI001BC95150|nr:hypothetical protein [Lederbergia citrea]MBS4177697.1 hypothetical protein [Lederbergia citrea]MBS4204374.1 hypothetical protein [Lederbergia citrea]